MIERLVEALRVMDPPPSAEELADALWLARCLPSSADAAEPRRAGTATGMSTGPDADAKAIRPAEQRNEPDQADEAGRPAEDGPDEAGRDGAAPAATGPQTSAPGTPPSDDTGTGRDLGAGGGTGGGTGDPAVADEPAPVPEAGLFLNGDGTTASFPVRSPTLPAVPGALRIARALRPLRVSAPSPLPGRLDEERTARRFAETGIWEPLLRPATERRFELVLVVDVAASMAVWRHTADELRLLLERLGAFRDVRVRYLDSDAARLTLRTGPGPDAVAVRGGDEPGGPAHRRIVLVASDCIGAAWWDGRAAALLERWGRAGPVAIVQPLPQRLWPRCGAATAQVRLRAPGPGVPNARLAARMRERGAAVPPGVAVPVMEPAPRWLGPWAAMIAGAGHEIATAALFTGRPVTEDPVTEPPAGEPSPLDRVLRFRASASPKAFELAGYLAAAPLRLPVMRLVQQAMLPRSTPAHLAEVFLGGLLRVDGSGAGAGAAPGPGAGRPDPYDIAYDFHDGVRDVLLGGLRRNEALQVLREVWDTVRDRLGSSLDFPALLAAVRRDAGVLPPDQPFAQVAARVLRRLGGRYGEIAERLADEASRPVHGGPVDARATGNGQVTAPPADPGAAVPEPPGDGPVRGGVPPRDAAFTGRTGLLGEIAERLRGAVTVLLPLPGHAPGGEGRTRLAAEYVHTRPHEYGLVWWIPAAGTAAVRASLAALARRLGTPRSDDAAVTVDNLLRALRNGVPHGRWLLVYDGAGDPADLLPLMPRASSSGDVLVTSRDARWADEATAVEVGAFERPESVALLRHRVPGLPEPDADGLAALLDDHPGAIDQAGLWLASTGRGAGEYMNLFTERARETAGREPPVALPAPYATALTLTVERLGAENPAARGLLGLWCHLGTAPVAAASLGTASGQAGAGAGADLARLLADEDALAAAMRAVARAGLGLLSGDPDRGTLALQVSPSAGTVAAYGLPVPARARLRDAVHGVLAAATPEAGPEDETTWAARTAITPHVIPSGIIDAEGAEARGVVLDQARFLYATGDFEGCRELAAEAMARWRSGHGEDDALVLDIARVLAEALRALGRFEEAARLGEATLERTRRTYGPDHPSVLFAADGVAADLRFQGDFPSAHELDENTWRRRDQRYGGDHPHTLAAAGAVATDLCLLGRFHEAHALDTEAWERLRRLDPADRDLADRDLVRVTVRLARDLHGLGRYEESLRTGGAVLERAAGLLGADHSLVLRARAGQAGTLRKAGRFDDAARLATETLEAHVRRFGAGHPDTLAATVTAALAQAAAGSPRAARDLAERAWAGYRRTLGDDHPFTRACAVDLAIVLRAAGDVQAALEADRTVLAAPRRGGWMGPDHYYSLCGAVGMANDLYLLGELEAAHDLSTRTRERFQARHGPTHPYTLACAHNHAMICRALGDPGAPSGAADPPGTGDSSGAGAPPGAGTPAALGAVLGADHPEVRAAAGGDLLDCDIEPPPL
ncbi:hypothetical protein GCM10023085_40690 [Actinomadura viridis]|uniref:Tetratricopeptide (TPR) repeat protein n=1 Tax=Actinomadura viridis TaxID=58110 RepID=A0A931DQ35_9ACTN|nr:FxSxx-COOH system tetratricopeptide repeat protein [Actinomadura viridis]MBG6092653.1 tetratricopeptide (TPR) repeat protein [Actinomadura viridis]